MALATINADPTPPELPDLNSADTASWPTREFGLDLTAVGAGIAVLVPQSVINHVQHHGDSRTDVEVCGVLVGKGYRTATGPVLFVEAAIRGEHATHQAAQVTFTAATWNHVQQVLDRDYPDLQIIGWYHTHPGFGIFLSDMDLFIHRHFFAGSEQLAWVYDPLGKDQGVFIWRAGAAVREPVMIMPDEAPREPFSSHRLAGLPTLTAAASMDDVFSKRLRRVENRQRWLGISLTLVAVLSVIWPWYLSQIATTSVDSVETPRPNMRPQHSFKKQSSRPNLEIQQSPGGSQ